MSDLSINCIKILGAAVKLIKNHMLLIYINNILVQKMINLTQRAILQAFFAVVSNLSTELSTDSVDNKNHKKNSQ